MNALIKLEQFSQPTNTFHFDHQRHQSQTITMSSSNSIIYKEMKDVPQEKLKDLQGKIKSALSDITLSEKIRLRILTPLQALNFHCNKLMEEQYLFLKDKTCFERLQTHLV